MVIRFKHSENEKFMIFYLASYKAKGFKLKEIKKTKRNFVVTMERDYEPERR